MVNEKVCVGRSASVERNGVDKKILKRDISAVGAPRRQRISPDPQGRLGLRHAEDHQTTSKEIGRPEAWTHDVWHVPEGSGVGGEWEMQLHDVAG